MSQTAFIGLGSNLGNRVAHLTKALSLFRNNQLTLLKASAIYQSEPEGPVQNQPFFCNAVAKISTELHPRSLLERCLNIEAQLGRKRGVAKGPRIIDIDLLLVDQQIAAWPELVLPHPQLTYRAYILVPLLEIEPKAVDPRDGIKLSTHFQLLTGKQRVERINTLWY
jgi:2-amino-4-hydroxy-6-hydroxymethyldihydropteridine diphosphokinase